MGATVGRGREGREEGRGGRVRGGDGERGREGGSVMGTDEGKRWVGREE